MINIIKPTPKPITDEILAKHTFTTGELLAISQKLAGVIQKTVTIEDEKKQVMSQYKASLDELASKQNTLATQIANGYEMQNTPCVLSMDYGRGIKVYHHRTSGELVAEIAMSQSDFQQQLKLDEFKFAEDGRCSNPIILYVFYSGQKIQIELAKFKQDWFFGQSLNETNVDTRKNDDRLINTHTAFASPQLIINSVASSAGLPKLNDLNELDFASMQPGTIIEYTVEDVKEEEKPKRKKKQESEITTTTE